jgi:hypothetical protein
MQSSTIIYSSKSTSGMFGIENEQSKLKYVKKRYVCSLFPMIMSFDLCDY